MSSGRWMAQQSAFFLALVRQSVVFGAVCLALCISARAKNAPPKCSLSVPPPGGAAPLTVTASVKCSDPENDITNVTLTWGDDSSYTPVPTQTSFKVQHTYGSAGKYKLTVTATDSGGLTGSATQTVNVSTNNQPPTCTLRVSPDQGQAPLMVTATGNCADQENDIVSEVLNWGDGTTTAGASETHTYSTAGTFTVKLTATDSGGLKGSASKSVKVAASKNAPPTCALAVAPAGGQAALAVTATGNCTDPENDIIREALNWGDGTTTDGTGGTHTYAAAGTFTVKLSATDSAGNTGSAAQELTVANSPQSRTPSCTVTATPRSGTAPLGVTVSANCADSRNDIAEVATSFGDGFYLTGTSSQHTYVSGGSYTVTVVARDKAGRTSQPASQTVTVSDNPALFVGVSNGQVAQFTRSGNKQTPLNSNQGGSMTGMAFDAAENLYVTNFTADTVSRFDGSNTLMGTFGSGYNCKPESIVFDGAGNAYVGETGCSHAMLKFDAYGNLEAAYTVSTEQEGSDWIDLASDQCTMFYTSQGTSVLRYNVCTKQQMPPFASGLNTALGVKVLPDQSVLVADKQDIVRFDSAGRKIMTYNAAGKDCWVGLALDSDNASFWATDYCSSDVVQFNINSGNEVFKFNSGTPANTVYGVIERVNFARLTAAGPLTSSPAQATISGGQSATFTLNFNPNGAAAGQTFAFSCAGLPANSSCSFQPASLVAGTSQQNTLLTIATKGVSAQLAPEGKAFEWALALALPWFGIAFVITGGEGKRPRKRLLLICLLLAFVVPLLSCSGASGNSSSTPPPGSPAGPPTPGSTTLSGTYAVVVRANSGGLQSTTVVTITVQ